MRNELPSSASGRPSSGRLRAILLGGAVLGWAGLAVASTSPVPPPPPVTVNRTDVTRASPELRIVAFGSSSTQGVGASSAAATYPSRLEALFAGAYRNRLLVRVVNRGIGGEDIDDMMRRLRTDVIARKPDLVIWQVGSNDALRGVSVDVFETELRDGIAAIRAAGAEVVLMDPQWSPLIDKVDASSRFVDAVGTVGTEQHVDVIRRFELMHRWMENGIASQAELIGPDGLHMTDKGYDLLAQAVFKELSSHSVQLQDLVSIAAKRP